MLYHYFLLLLTLCISSCNRFIPTTKKQSYTLTSTSLHKQIQSLEQGRIHSSHWSMRELLTMQHASRHTIKKLDQLLHTTQTAPGITLLAFLQALDNAQDNNKHVSLFGIMQLLTHGNSLHIRSTYKTSSHKIVAYHATYTPLQNLSTGNDDVAIKITRATPQQEPDLIIELKSDKEPLSDDLCNELIEALVFGNLPNPITLITQTDTYTIGAHCKLQTLIITIKPDGIRIQSPNNGIELKHLIFIMLPL